MNHWAFLNHFSNSHKLPHMVSMMVCWVLFLLPLYAIIRSFTRSRKGETSEHRINLFVRHSILFQETFLSWFRFSESEQGIYQNLEGRLFLQAAGSGHTGCRPSAFVVNDQSFEFGKNSLNPAIDLLENGGMLRKGIIYQITHDADGRIIRVSVGQEDWRLLRETYHSSSVPKCSLAVF